MALFFAPLRVPIADPRTGLMSREWYLFFQGLYDRTGGAIAPSNDDLQQASSDTPGTSQVDAIQARMFQDILQAPLPQLVSSSSGGSVVQEDTQQPTIGALMDLIAELQKQIQDLRQGVII